MPRASDRHVPITWKKVVALGKKWSFLEKKWILRRQTYRRDRAAKVAETARRRWRTRSSCDCTVTVVNVHEKYSKKYCWKYIQKYCQIFSKKYRQKYCQIYCWKYVHILIDVYACIFDENTSIYFQILIKITCIYCSSQENILLLGSHIHTNTYIYNGVRIIYCIAVYDILHCSI